MLRRALFRTDAPTSQFQTRFESGGRGVLLQYRPHAIMACGLLCLAGEPNLPEEADVLAATGIQTIRRYLLDHFPIENTTGEWSQKQEVTRMLHATSCMPTGIE